MWLFETFKGGIIFTLIVEIIMSILFFILATRNATEMKSDDELFIEHLKNKQKEELEQQKQFNVELSATIQQLELDLETSHLNYNTLHAQYEKAKTEIKSMAKHSYKKTSELQKIISWLKINEPVVLKRYKAEIELKK